MDKPWKENNKLYKNILAYHSSPVKFKEFDFSKINTATGDGGMYGPGFYFAEVPEMAKMWNKKGYLYKCILYFQNPYICYSDEDRNNLADLIKAHMDDSGKNHNDMTEFFEKGFDSIISLNEKWDNPETNDVKYHNQYVAFKPNQIQILNIEKYDNSEVTT